MLETIAVSILDELRVLFPALVATPYANIGDHIIAQIYTDTRISRCSIRLDGHGIIVSNFQSDTWIELGYEDPNLLEKICEQIKILVNK